MRNILIYVDSFNERYGLGLNYMELMSNYGAVTGINPYNARWKLLQEADILVLPGGADIDPERYGEVPEFNTQRSNIQYEWLDRYFLPDWIKTGKPIIGICRGMQDLNVAMGGTLYQHIHGHQGDNNKRAQEWHDIYTRIKTKDEDFRVYGTNSFHHQCVRDMAPGFEMIGFSLAFRNCPSISGKKRQTHRTELVEFEKDKNGKISSIKAESFYVIPEIMKHKTLPYIAFQYHPEDMNCSLFHYLVEQMLEEHYNK